MDRFMTELRSEVSGSRVRGYASVFEQTAVLPAHYERIARSAFDAALQRDDADVRALFNHDPSNLLGRQSSGTLRVGVDAQGLEFEVDLPDTSLGRDVRALMERGDITGASFGFIPDQDTWSKAPDGRRVRTHTSVRSLVDVSVVTFPAYGGASAALRSLNIPPRVDSRRRLILARAAARATHQAKRSA